jgi:hypothetical protein
VVKLILNARYTLLLIAFPSIFRRGEQAYLTKYTKNNFWLYGVVALCIPIGLSKGCPNSYLGSRIVFPLDLRATKHLLALFLKANNKFSLSLTLFIHKWHYYSTYWNINYIAICANYCRVTRYCALICSCNSLYLAQILPEKLTFYLNNLRSTWTTYVLPEQLTFYLKNLRSTWKTYVLPEKLTFYPKNLRSTRTTYVLPEQLTFYPNNLRSTWTTYVLPEKLTFYLNNLRSTWTYVLPELTFYLNNLRSTAGFWSQ